MTDDRDDDGTDVGPEKKGPPRRERTVGPGADDWGDAGNEESEGDDDDGFGIYPEGEQAESRSGDPDGDDDFGNEYYGAEPDDKPPVREETVFDPSAMGTDAGPDDPPRENAVAWEGESSFDDDEQGSIPVGSIIQHNYEIKRFIARGGMGEVYEGTNVHLDERLAIKVILPQWARKKEVVEQFRLEAGTLNKLQHDALVQYRNFIYDVQLDVYCLVIEYIDGDNLADVLEKVKPTAAELRALLIRLASGLRVAHGHGAIHRDMSPDNIILKDGRLDQAKIIDFGIAKDLNQDGKSIFGGSFAGKLAYAAPEQLGMFDRQMGTWSDVYSLALTIKAVARGRDLSLGATPADAIIMRQNGIELDDVPEELRPVLELMLKANPAERLQTMDDVLKAIESKKRVFPAKGERKKEKRATSGAAKSKMPILVVSGLLVLLLLGALATYLVWPDGEEEDLLAGGETPTLREDDLADVARSTFNAALPNIDCSWLEEDGITTANGQVSLQVSGVAGDPARAQSQLLDELEVSGLANANVSFADVTQISRAGCNVLNAFRERQVAGVDRLEAEQRRFEMTTLTEGTYAGRPGAKTLFNFMDLDNVQDYAILSIEPSGEITMLAADRAYKAENFSNLFTPIQGGGGERGEFEIALSEGWTGIILVTGEPPFERDLLAPPIETRSADWRRRFREVAAERQWQIEMEWVELVDNEPN